MTDIFSVPGILHLSEQASDPSSISGVAQLYAKNISGATKFFVRDGLGSIWQLGGSILNTGLFGSGYDGSLTYDGTTAVLGVTPSSNTYTLSADVMATDLTVNNGVTIKTNGYRIFCTGTLTNHGTISDNGGNGGNGSFGVNPTTVSQRAAGFYSAASGSQLTNSGSAGTVSNFPYGIGTTHAAITGGAAGSGGGNNGSNGSNGAVAFQGGSGGGGGGSAALNNAAAGVEGGAITTTAATAGKPDLVAFMRGYTAASTQMGLSGTGGGNGGGGGTGSTVFTHGAGGGGGGIVAVFAKIIAGNGSFQAKGGNGGNGGSSSSGANFGSGGGAGGGGGGLVVLAYGTNTGSNTTDVSGGTHGTGGVGTGGSSSGGNGGDGQAGAVITFSGDGT